MTNRVTVGNLRVAQVLHDFITNEALPGTGVDPDSFWSGVDKVVADLTPKNQELLARRDDLQAQIDKWHRAHVLEPVDPEAYKQRNTTERAHNRLKAFRAVAMRTDKREFVYNGTIDVASIRIWLSHPSNEDP